jgi:hypothetical protein
MAEIFNRNNFHKNTFCIFNEADPGEIANLTLGYKSKSGSSYYFTQTGVYRLSDHWGRAANCKWRLQSTQKGGRTKLGFAQWTAFHRDNDTEKLYFIELIHDGVHFQHKDNGNFNGQLLRTASETTKRIRQIRNLLENDAWTKYYPNENPQDLKENAIAQMISTDKTLQQIKSGLA